MNALPQITPQLSRISSSEPGCLRERLQWILPLLGAIGGALAAISFFAGMRRIVPIEAAITMGCFGSALLVIAIGARCLSPKASPMKTAEGELQEREQAKSRPITEEFFSAGVQDPTEFERVDENKYRYHIKKILYQLEEVFSTSRPGDLALFMLDLKQSKTRSISKTTAEILDLYHWRDGDMGPHPLLLHCVAQYVKKVKYSGYQVENPCKELDAIDLNHFEEIHAGLDRMFYQHRDHLWCLVSLARNPDFQLPENVNQELIGSGWIREERTIFYSRRMGFSDPVVGAILRECWMGETPQTLKFYRPKEFKRSLSSIEEERAHSLSSSMSYVVVDVPKRTGCHSPRRVGRGRAGSSAIEYRISPPNESP